MGFNSHIYPKMYKKTRYLRKVFKNSSADVPAKIPENMTRKGREKPASLWEPEKRTMRMNDEKKVTVNEEKRVTVNGEKKETVNGEKRVTVSGKKKENPLRHSPTDRRVARTRRSIRMALIKLLANKPLGEVTVTELARAADINRKTFYNYYGDVSMVVDEIENEIVEEFAAAIHKINFRELNRDPSVIYLVLARLIEKDLEFYARVFAAEAQTSLLQKIVAPLKNQLRASFADAVGSDAEGFEYLLEYTISGMIAVYQKWFNTGRRQDIEELSRSLSVLTFNGINGLTDQSGK